MSSTTISESGDGMFQDCGWVVPAGFEGDVEEMAFGMDMLCAAVEHCGYGWFKVDAWCHDLPLGEGFAKIRSDDEPGVVRRVSAQTMLDGVAVIATAVLRDVPGEEDQVWCNAVTGERLWLWGGMRQEIVDAHVAREAGDLDVAHALAILECALFGRVVYA